MELSRQIDILNTKLSAIPYLGNGGCVHFAYYFSERLSALGIKHEIIGFDRGLKVSYKSRMIDRWVRDKKCFKLAFNHVMVKVEDYYVDGYIKVKHGDCRFFAYDNGRISFHKLELIREHGAWNDWYNTGNNKLMNKIIKEVIK